MTKSKETTTQSTPATGIKRTGNTRSAIWNHFTKIGNGQQSKCNYCGKVFASDSSKSGTSSLWKHIDVCNAYKSIQFDEKQKTLTRQKTAGDNGEDPVFNLTSTIFNKDECRRSLIRMIIIDELPFSFVDGEGFKDFVKTLCPRFEVPSRRTVVREVLYLYNETKESLKNKLIQNRQRVSLTTDCWTSIQNINYMVITAHFIDKNWTLHKRILSFSVVPSHKGETIGKLVENCLLDWGIEYVASITVDNANANDTAVTYVKNKLKNWKVDSLILGGAYLHIRCSARIVNLIVNEGLKEFNPCISSIRNAVKYFRSSPSRYMKFKSCIEREKIVCKKLACLDVPTRWNSTFLMLDSALHFEKAFERMEEEDGLYYKYFTERENGQEREGPPSSVDWEKARKFSKFLRTFYDVTLKFSSSLHVTSNIYFKEICNIEHALETLGNKDDIMLSSMTRNMKLKFDKYWGTVEKMNKILILAIILDPRYKLEYVSYCASILYDVNKVNTIKTEVTKLIYAVYNEYKGWHGTKDGIGASSSNDRLNVIEDSDDDDMDAFNKVDLRYKKLRSSSLDLCGKDEIQKYLVETVEDPEGAFDILYWWKINKSRFEILSEIARDVLAIPVSTVASESAFSTGGRILDSFRSSLTPKTVEALICAQNWLREDSRLLRVIEDGVCIEEEELQKIETEFVSATATTQGVGH